MSSAGDADVNKAQSIFGGLSEGDSGGPFALLVDTFDTLDSLESRILDAIFVDG